jgi:hypothetical protein
MGQRRICGKIDIIVIASLFQKVEQILTGYVFEKKEKKVRGLQRAMQRDNVGMHRHGLVDGRLCQLYEFFLIKIGFGQEFNSIFTAIL